MGGWSPICSRGYSSGPTHPRFLSRTP
jgi:hypothetical protein